VRHQLIFGITKISLRKINLNLLKKKIKDLLTFHQIFTFKEYDMNLGFVPQFVVDAGANIGFVGGVF
jgi:hypothetical protein